MAKKDSYNKIERYTMHKEDTAKGRPNAKGKAAQTSLLKKMGKK